MVHATSPAVPPEATARVEAYARREGWRLAIIDAGEFADPDYLANPANRCFFCKTNLYGAIAARTGATIVSGTNRRPRRLAPGVAGGRGPRRTPPLCRGRHRQGRRARSPTLLASRAELPAAPCLSSRLATGIRVTLSGCAWCTRSSA